MGGTMTFLSGANTPTIRKVRYQASARDLNQNSPI
jgi:hypothetical protein